MASRSRWRIGVTLTLFVASAVVGVNIVLYRTNDNVRLWWEDARRSVEAGRRYLDRLFH
jgi:hypothetical protein